MSAPGPAPVPEGRPSRAWLLRLRRTVLEADTPAGRLYNLTVFGAILLSVLLLLFDGHPLEPAEVRVLELMEEVTLAVFVADFLLHLLVSVRPLQYLFSFYGLIDFMAVLFFFVPQINSGLLLWVFKFGRVLRVFKLLRFMDEATTLANALRASARRIVVFIFFVVILQVVLGYAMVAIESVHPETQFTSVAQGVYWAIVTMTTVGYGDFVPQTSLGRVLAAVVMMLGFGIIAIPTGIVTYEGLRQTALDSRTCGRCGRYGHRPDARHCDRCGAPLDPSSAV
ncbi:ion transporter [Synechococcus sp. RSCCF101]|uniref:ion transporter n=1 Tax=Synechococcus sp. RSCCF101 TaxID=2511069 RepID=UPI0012461B32|nr:ion transporter [Synechococcus sp. RSCCF101]QEY32466.1 ion transporter [Synechococcus sp. RSCCF101]